MKYTSGMLCRDKVDAGPDKAIAFFPTTSAAELQWGVWRWASLRSWIDLQRISVWTPEDWKKEYSIIPPKPGKCFEVDIEL